MRYTDTQVSARPYHTSNLPRWANSVRLVFGSMVSDNAFHRAAIVRGSWLMESAVGEPVSAWMTAVGAM
ncbi:hypothetical protein D9M68_940910 [compost metagenome]